MIYQLIGRKWLTEKCVEYQMKCQKINTSNETSKNK